MAEPKVVRSRQDSTSGRVAPGDSSVLPGPGIRIQTALLGLVAIPLLAMIAALAYDVYRQNEQNIADANAIATALAGSAAQQTEQFLQRAEHELSVLAQRSRVQALDPENCDPLLVDLKAFQPAFANVLTLDLKGQLVCSAIGTLPGQSRGPDPKYYFAETVRTRAFTVGKPAKGFLSGRWVSTLAYPIKDSAGQLIGVVAASIDLATYQPFVAHGTATPGAVVGILNRDRTLIARSEDAAQRVGSIADNEASKTIVAQPQGMIRARAYQGIDRFIAFTPIAHSDWKAFASIDAAVVLAPTRRAALQRLGFGGVVLLALGMLTLLAARRIARPIEEFTAKLEAIRQGDAQSRALPSGPQEIYRIGVELNAMLDAGTQSAAALRDSEVRYRDLFDNNPQPMWVFDAETLAFVAVNTAALKQYGYSRDEFFAMTIRDIRPTAEARRLREYLAGAETERQDKGRWTHMRKDGSLIEVEVTSRALDYGHRRARLVLATDVTARGLAEAEKNRLNSELDSYRLHLEVLVASRTAELAAARLQAEEANRAKSAFLANMSHEIRTPLNAIVGLNYLIRREPVTPAQAVRLEKIDAAGQHLLSIINDVLDLSKIEAGRVQIESTNFHLSAVLDSVHSIIAEAARAKGLTVEVDGNAVPIWLRGDPTRLRQALLNFAGNAVKFTEKGSIALRAKLLHEEGDELLVRFAVDDTGIGISPEQLPRLFQAFEQADATITRKFGGTGLGLAISQRLAGLLGGECGVESEAGVGSTFWFTARLLRGHGVMPSPAADATADAEMQLRQRHRGARILLVEDNEVNLEVALAMLHGVGLDVDTAIDGREAVRIATANVYDLVLMDMQMPELSGLEATRSIRALPGWQTRPILALTANAFDEDRQACAAAGMNDFITKPMEVSRFYEALLRWLDAGAARTGDAGGVPATAVP